VNKRKAGGVTSLHVSSNRTEIKLKGKLSISLKTFDNSARKKDNRSEMNCGWWNESSQRLMSGDCTVTDSTGDILTCSCPHLTDFMTVVDALEP